MAEFKRFISNNAANNSSLNDVIEEMFLEVKKDAKLMAHLKEIGIDNDTLIKNNISTITKYKEDIDYCAKCPGFELCNKKHPHYVYDIQFNGRIVNNELRACDYKVEDNKKNESYVVRDFPKDWRSSTIPGMDKSKVRQELLFRYKKAISQNPTYRWLYITGSHRSGKSHMAAALINAYIELFKTKVAFINYPIRIRELVDLSYSNKDDFFKILTLYSTIDCLVIDDFGNEYKNEYIRDSITLAILNERARLGLFTIFTSAFNYDDIADMYALNISGKARGKQIKNLLTSFAGEEIDISTVAIY